MEMQRETDASGKLRYIAGSIAIHVLDREFVRRMAKAKGQAADAGSAAAATNAGATLPFHRADKKIATINETGESVKPEKANG